MIRAKQEMIYSQIPYAFFPVDKGQRVTGIWIMLLMLLINHSLVYGAVTIIRPGDVIEVSSGTHAQLNFETRVNSRGEAGFPLIGNVKISGKTVDEAESFLVYTYSSGYLRNVSLKLRLTSFTEQFYVLGEVYRGGNFQWYEGVTVLRAIALAGGTRISLKSVEIRIVRGGKILIVYPWDALSTDPALDILVKANDIIAAVSRQER